MTFPLCIGNIINVGPIEYCNKRYEQFLVTENEMFWLWVGTVMMG